MTPDRPKAGMVLRYSLLWGREAAEGREEGSKDRPVMVVVLLADGEELVVAPFTTKSPASGDLAVSVPHRVLAHLGLNAEQSWISVETLNRFVWPGPDLRPIPGRQSATVLYGYAPQALLNQVRALVLTKIAERVPGLVVRRSE